MSLTIDSEGLHPIANVGHHVQADIVFVHGLGGKSHDTWRHGKVDAQDHFFWPEVLGGELRSCGIWTLGYPAGITGLGNPGMIIEKQAGNLSQKLASADFGRRPLVFITHSMGGLIVKSLCVTSQTQADQDRKRLVNNVRGIVFCATPHRGSAFADAAGILGKALGGSQPHVDEMRINADQLDLLHEKFVEWHRLNPIPVLSYAETRPLFRKRWYWRALPLGVVVPRASANPYIAGYSINDVPADHITIVKPRNQNDDVYAGVLRWIKNKVLNIDKDDQPARVEGAPPLATPASRRVAIHFDDAMVANPVSSTLALDRLKSGESVEVDWPTASNVLIDSAESLIRAASVSSDVNAVYDKWTREEVANFIDKLPIGAPENLKMKRLEVERRLVHLVAGAAPYFGGMGDRLRTIMQNYLTLANFHLHSGLAYNLTYDKLPPGYLPDIWNELMTADNNLRRGGLRKLFNISGKLVNARVRDFSGKDWREYCWGPLAVVQAAAGRGRSGTDWCVGYVIPQLEYSLAMENSEEVIQYEEGIYFEKLSLLEHGAESELTLSQLEDIE